MEQTRTKSIFRPQALSRYYNRQAKPVFPMLVSPRVCIYLWTLLFTLVGMILLAAVTKVPVYEKGVAIVVTDDCDAPGLKKHLQLAVFLSPESLPFLKKEERILIKTERDNQLSNTSIVTFMPEVLSPSQLQMRFPLVPSVAAQIKGPKVMAMVNMELPSSSVACSNHMGSIYQVQYEIGERRLLTILF